MIRRLAASLLLAALLAACSPSQPPRPEAPKAPASADASRDPPVWNTSAERRPDVMDIGHGGSAAPGSAA